MVTDLYRPNNPWSAVTVISTEQMNTTSQPDSNQLYWCGVLVLVVDNQVTLNIAIAHEGTQLQTVFLAGALYVQSLLCCKQIQH